MASKTEHYGLNKPGYDERPDVELFNENADIVDATVKALADEVDTKADQQTTEQHISDDDRHITPEERTAWNGKETPEGAAEKAVTAAGVVQQNLADHSNNAQHITGEERAAWNDKWDYDEDEIKTVKVDKAADADTVNGKTVAADVPAGAVFTDTVYTHPETHPPSIIKQDTNNRFVTDAKQQVWDGKADPGDIPTKVSQLTNDKGYVTGDELGNAGYGDMLKSVYDTNGNGKVDVAENAEKLGGKTPAQYQDVLGFTPENSAKKGTANGYAGLDAGGKVPESQLPEIESGVGEDHLTDFVPHGIMAASSTISYDGNGNVTQVEVKQGTTLKARTTLTYSADKVSTINVKKYAANGSTVEREYTDTIVYSGENVTGVNRVVNK